MVTIRDKDLSDFLYIPEEEYEAFVAAGQISRGGGTWVRGKTGIWKFTPDHEEPKPLSDEENEALQQEMDDQIGSGFSPI